MKCLIYYRIKFSVLRKNYDHIFKHEWSGQRDAVGAKVEAAIHFVFCSIPAKY